MRTTKKYFMFIISFLAFALISFIFAFSPIYTAYAATEMAMSATITNYELMINSVKIPNKDVDVSSEDPEKRELKIPLLNAEMKDANTYSILVIDPAGETHTYNKGDTASSTESEDDSITADYFNYDKVGEGYLTLNALNNGRYKIVYVVTKGDKKYYSNVYTVNVKNVSYELDFTIQEGEDKGLEKLLPTNMKPTSQALELPVAHVRVVGKDTVAEGKTVKITVTKDGALQDPTKADSAYKLVGGKPQLDVSKEGKYVIEYTFGGGANRPTKTYTINVSDDFVAPTKNDLTITTPTMPTIELGQTDVTLPKLTVSDNVNDNAVYNLKSIVITKSNNNKITTTLTNNDYTFDMTKEAFKASSYKDMVGNYEVKYTIVDAYGNEKSVTYVVKNVTDSTRPSVYMAYNYNLVKEGDTVTGVEQTTDKDGKSVDKVNLTYNVDLKSKYGYSEIVLPAIYAKDKVSNYTDFKFVRYIQNTNTKTIYYLDNVKVENGEYVKLNPTDTGYNHSGDENIGNFNKAVRFAFVDESDTDKMNSISAYSGEYQLGYYVYSNTVSQQENYVYSSGTSRYSFNVLGRATVGSDTTDTTTPEISINNVRNLSTVSSYDDLTVNFTASDFVKDDKGNNTTTVNDSRLKNVVFYHYGTKTGATNFKDDLMNAVQAVREKDTTDSHNNHCHVFDDAELVTEMQKLYEGFAIAEKDDANANQAVVKFAGYDDYETKPSTITIVAVTLNDNNNVAFDTRTLNIKNDTESVPPTATITDCGSLGTTAIDNDKTFNQIVDVTLPTVQFTDTDTSLSLNVAYYVESPETASAGLQFRSPTDKDFTSEQNTIVGGTITTDKIGWYYVVYTATDDAGNSSVVYFTFYVQDSSAPILNVDVTSDDKITKSGNTVSADTGSVISFDPTVLLSDGKTEVTFDSKTEIKVTIDDGGKGLDYFLTGSENTYQFNSEGSYTVKFTAKYDTRDAVEKIVYVNVSEPTLAWNDNDVSVVTTAGLNDYVILPDLTASQGKVDAVISVKVTDPDGHTPVAGEVERVIVDGNRVWRFKTNERTKGTYKVVYTATTANGSLEKTYSIKVGDNVAPTFVVDKDKLTQEIVYDGTDIEYKINVNKSKNTFEIVVKSGDTTLYTYSGLEIWDKDDLGVNSKQNSWTNLTVELTGDNVIAGEESGQYFIKGKGVCTLKLTMPDRYGNSEPKSFTFNVTEKTEVKENKDAVVGTVLIVVSLVLLAGVILFFLLTGKKGGTSHKRNKKSDIVIEVENNEKVQDIKVEETKVEEVVEEKKDNTATDNTDSNNAE